VKAKESARGFLNYEPRADLNSSSWYVGESSLATQPAIRLYLTDMTTGEPVDAGLHLTIDETKVLIRQLRNTIRNHYQLRARTSDRKKRT
jgi:hypothetical protein